MSKFWVADSFHFYLGHGIFNLEDDDFYLALVDSTLDSNYDDWAADTAYTAGDIVIPTTRNGRRYICTVAGDSDDTTEPTWPTDDDDTVVDNEVTWQEYGGDMCDMELWSEASGSEVANGNGYTTNGAALAGMALTSTNRVTKWDATDVTFSSLTKTFRTGWLYRSGTVDGVINPVVGYILFDDSYADKTITAVDFVAQWSSSGVYTFTS